jgi:glycosyl hydrolase family 38/alpha mannosidase-like protein
LAKPPVVLVPHTHWDREWYLPFQSFRLSLVKLVDKVLDMLEADPRFVFTLDGQLQTVDDYLEVRPEAEPRIRALVEEGRLAVGPWQTLMDEFLVSGETIVRNLERGLARGDELGGAMRIGYLPDMFGHVAQMPQILRLAGIEQAVVWRGVPEAIDRHAFLWQGPDGSEVRAEYLPRGYGNAAHVFADPERLADEIEALHEALQPFFDGDPLLAMYGNDHTEPDPGVMELVETVRERVAIELKTLPGYLDGADGAGLRRWVGELRSGARANLLMGVTSARIDLKAACARAERSLERYAEPLQALHGAVWPERMLELAWSRVLENSAHDSICGCSTDEVSAQVLVRYAEAEQIAHGLATDAVESLARGVERGSVAVVNPSPQARAGLVELEVQIPGEWAEVGLELPDGRIAATQVAGDRFAAIVPAPALGWTSVHPVPAAGTVENPVRAGARGLSNGLLELEVAEDGTLDLLGGGRELHGAGRLVDGGDVGDSYNYAPPGDEVLVDQPEEVRVDVVSTGPVRGELDLVRTYRWQDERVEVTTRIELRAGEPFCRVLVSFENRRSNHRLRFHIPLAERAEVSAAEGQFAVVERGLEAEGGHGEVPLATFPARGFVAAGGVAALLDHVMEYELVGGRELALTLLRSIGFISRADNPYRKVNAGPEVPLPAGQCRGPWSIGFALMPHAGSWQKSGVPAEMERYQHPFLTAPGSGERSGAPEPAGLELRGEGVVLSALRQRGGRLEARVFCQRPEPCQAVLVRKGFEISADLRPWEIKTMAFR